MYFLTLPQLVEFVRDSEEETRLSQSLLEFELRDQPKLYFCGWCGLGRHDKGACHRGH